MPQRCGSLNVRMPEVAQLWLHGCWQPQKRTSVAISGRCHGCDGFASLATGQPVRLEEPGHRIWPEAVPPAPDGR